MGEVKGLLIDLDGTTYTGGEAIAGVPEALERLRSAGIPFRFVTNTTSKPRRIVQERLGDLGIEVPAGEIFTATTVARDWLKAEGLMRCDFLVRDELLEDLDGIEAVREAPDAVVLGDLGDAFTYEALNRAFRSLMDGSRFVALAQNRYFRGSDGLNLDVGAFAAALEFGSGQSPTVIGKPSEAFFRTALASIGVAPEEAAMIGDDLEGDIGGAQNAGLRGLLVKTGKFQSTFLESPIQPDAVLDSLAELPGWLDLPVD